MRFCDFLHEQYHGTLAVNEIPVISGDPNVASKVSDADVRDFINLHLFDELDAPVITIESGYAKIHQVMGQAGFMFSSFPIPTEGDGEEIFALSDDGYYLYIAFFEDDNGYYEFHAEVVSEDELNEILSID